MLLLCFGISSACFELSYYIVLLLDTLMESSNVFCHPTTGDKQASSRTYNVFLGLKVTSHPLFFADDEASDLLTFKTKLLITKV